MLEGIQEKLADELANFLMPLAGKMIDRGWKKITFDLAVAENGLREDLRGKGLSEKEIEILVKLAQAEAVKGLLDDADKADRFGLPTFKSVYLSLLAERLMIYNHDLG